MKRFWRDVGVVAEAEGFVVTLDARTVRTPKRQPLLLPTRALADLVAAEWRAQGETVQPDTMPINRLATSVVDLMPERRPAALEQLLGYARTDLLCYRAAGPENLLAAYRQHWDPPLTWLARTHGPELRVVEGLMPAAQNEAVIEGLQQRLVALDDWRLVGVHGITTVTASLVLGLMVEAGALTAEAAAAAALVDEHAQQARWGQEAEALGRERRLRGDVHAASSYLGALG
ncbi:MAG: ATPase [Geminicoccaceae bacterium]|nr:MAG: ATPase [Geminicoccaceae bacterium]